MQRLLAKLDALIGIGRQSPIAAWLDRLSFVFLVLMVLAAPHSIAATQTAWLAGMLFFIARLFFTPRPSFRTGWLGAALGALFLWTVLSSFLSYASDISFGKLRSAALFLIFFFVIGVVRSFRAVYCLAFALIVSCMFSVLLMPLQRIVGRGVEIQALQPDGALARAGIQPGDVLIAVDREKVGSPEEIASALREKESATIKYQRIEFYHDAFIRRSDASAGEIENGTLGITDWKRSRTWRSAGFYGHYTTYAEVLQLIGSLLVGIFVAAFLSGRRKEIGKSLLETFTKPPANLKNYKLRFAATGAFVLFCVVAFCVALLLTVTRAPQLAFLISGFLIMLLGASRRWLVTALLITIPVAAVGLFVLQRSREVGFFDAKDNSTNWRMMVYREGFGLWTANARHFFFGVGMDSIKRHACDWGLFDNCRQPMGHFHSTPLQLAVERGLPALLLWLTVLGVYARTLRRSLRSNYGEETIWRNDRLLPDFSPALNRGIWLGALGGLVGFFSSSLVHYNYGDGEVVMVFYLIMGLALKTGRLAEKE